MGSSVRKDTHKHEGFHRSPRPPCLRQRRCSTPCERSWSDLSPVCLQTFPGRTQEHCPVKGFRSCHRLSLRFSQQTLRSKGCHWPSYRSRYCTPSCPRCLCFPSCPCCPRLQCPYRPRCPSLPCPYHPCCPCLYCPCCPCRPCLPCPHCEGCCWIRCPWPRRGLP